METRKEENPVCHKCGGRMVKGRIIPPITYFTYTPPYKQEYKCPNCGESEFRDIETTRYGVPPGPGRIEE